jgi:hypothetical protein
MRRLLLVLSLAALLAGAVATTAQTAGPGLKASQVNFGKVYAGTTFTAVLTLTNSTNETIINIAAPDLSGTMFASYGGGWQCGGVVAHGTCMSTFSFNTDLALVKGTNRITESVTLNGTGATTGNTYSVTVKFVATQISQL